MQEGRLPKRTETPAAMRNESGFINKIRAFLTAAVAAPLVAATILTIEDLVKTGGRPAFTILGDLVIGYLVSGLAEFVLGGPLFLLGLRLKLIRWWWSATVGGFAVGAMAISIAALPHVVLLTNLASCCATGAFAGFAFWLVWQRGNRAPAN